ncbi:sperm-associated microtubule inner protein 4 [Tautogolabrus adspersus]
MEFDDNNYLLKKATFDKVNFRPIISQRCYYNTGRKKSKVRLNDQLIPKPTDINMAEKMIKIATPKQHPYSSHISQFAMFPSFCSPDDPETGVRATSKLFPNPPIPNRAPDVTLLSKTKGSPYRLEVLESPFKNNKKAVMWTGEHGFLDHSKPLRGEKQLFYPTPPRTVLPNQKLRDWDLTLSEQTSNMLKNLERTHWLTSYQMHYTGSGPANPLKIDDFREKMSELTGMNSLKAPLRERSFPVFVPSKPTKGCRRRQRSCLGRNHYSPFGSETLNLSTSPNQTIASDNINQPRLLAITAEHNMAPDPNQRVHSQSKNSSGSTGAQSAEPSQEVLDKQQTEKDSSAHKGRERENSRVQFNESVLQSCQEANPDTERLLDMHHRPLYQRKTEVKTEKSLCVKDESCSENKAFRVRRNICNLGHSAGAKDLAGTESEIFCRSSEQETLGKSKVIPRSICNPCILQRPSVLPDFLPEGRLGTLSLLELQNSFSRTAAHHNFNRSITHAAVNLRDNVVTGKKHVFHGINCYYLHG